MMNVVEIKKTMIYVYLYIYFDNRFPFTAPPRFLRWSHGLVVSPKPKSY